MPALLSKSHVILAVCATKVTSLLLCTNDNAVRLLQHHKVRVKELVTHRHDFSEAEMGFENVERRQGIKTIIHGPDTGQTQGTIHRYR